MSTNQNPPAVLIRQARPDERAQLQRVIDAAYAEFEPHVEETEWVTMTTNIATVIAATPVDQLLVAESAGELVGTVAYLPPGPRTYNRVPQDWAVVRTLAVEPAWRGRGIARRLTEACLERAEADGAPAVGLHTMDRMVVARRMYESMGFVKQDGFTHLGLPFWIYALHLDAER